MQTDPVDSTGNSHASPTGRRRAGLRVCARLGVAAAAVVAVSLTAIPSEPAQAIGPLPSCELGEVYTVPRGYDDWSTTLVDRLLRVEKDYVPPDLIPSREAGIGGGGQIRRVAADDTREMAKAAKSAGAPIAIWSGYRSYKEQVGLFTMYTRENGFDSAITYSQRPGHSEHQLGLGVDFMSAGGGSPLPGDWAKTPAGAWMRDNSWKYGWVNSYPRGKDGKRWNEQACFRYEPWHYRYLGKDMAAKVHASGLTIREYLWKHHVQLDRNGKPAVAETTTVTTPTASPTTAPAPPATTAATPSAPSTPAPSETTPAVEPTVASPPTQEATSTSGSGLPWGLVVGALVAAVGAGAAVVARRKQGSGS